MSASHDAQQNGKPAGTEDRRPLRDGIDTARTQVVDAASIARDRAVQAVGTARDRGLAGSIEANPLVAVLGGIGLGVVIGALLPRTERETELLGDFGRRIQDGAREAAGAARDAGQARFAELGLDRDHVSDTARGFIENILAAAASAGAAALDSAKRGPDRD